MEFMKNQLSSLVIKYSFAVLVGLTAAGCSEKPLSPDFFEVEWKALSVNFCTESSAHEAWQTRDKDKLELLQGALTVGNPQAMDHIVKSYNHAIEIELASEQGSEHWQLVINRDQQHVSYYQLANPARSFSAESDAMFYRALNTLLKSHMGESLDIFRKCELSTL